MSINQSADVFSQLNHVQNELVSSFVPGCDIAVSLDGHCVYRETKGFADLAKKQELTGRETYFAWSGTKIVTSALAMMLIEEGKLRLDDRLSDYWPEFSEMTVREDGVLRSAQTPITVGMLLSMTAGFNYDLSLPGIAALKKENPHCPIGEVMPIIAAQPLDFEPGTRFEYGLSHDVLGAVMERVTKERLGILAERMLFAPLGMRDTSYGMAKGGQLDRMATQYLWRNDIEAAVPMKKVNGYILGDEYDSGGAGIVTTTDDFFTFVTALACGKILSEKTRNLWRSPVLTAVQQADFSGKWDHTGAYSYGYGVETMVHPEKYGESGYCDFGWGGAAGMRAYVFPDERAACVVMMHLHDYPNRQFTEQRIRNAVVSCLKQLRNER